MEPLTFPFGENNMKMEKRQFITIFIAVAALIFLGRELYILIFRNTASTATSTQNQMINQSSSFHYQARSDIPNAKDEQHLNPKIKNNRYALVQSQREYIELIHKVEIAKIQRRLIDEEVAIAAAKNRIAMLNSQTEKLNDKNRHSPETTNKKNNTPSRFNNFRSFANIQTPLTTDLKNTNSAQKKEILALAPTPKSTDMLKIDTYTLDEIQLLELPANNYTITLKGSFNKHDLEMYAKENNLGPKAIYYSVQRRGKLWFVLLYDHYNTKEEANSALQQLPQSLQQDGPTVKSIDDIQQAIKAQKQ